MNQLSTISTQIPLALIHPVNTPNANDRNLKTIQSEIPRNQTVKNKKKKLKAEINRTDNNPIAKINPLKNK
jgi:hypothetical protein